MSLFTNRIGARPQNTVFPPTYSDSLSEISLDDLDRAELSLAEIEAIDQAEMEDFERKRPFSTSFKKELEGLFSRRSQLLSCHQVSNTYSHPSSFTIFSDPVILENVRSNFFRLEAKMLVHCRSRMVIYSGPSGDSLLRQKVRGVIQVILEMPRREISLDIAKITFNSTMKTITLVIGCMLLDVASAVETRILPNSLSERAIFAIEWGAHPKEIKERVSYKFFMNIHTYFAYCLDLEKTVEEARTLRQPRYIRRKKEDRSLERSLIITEKDDRYICFNRKKKGDFCLSGSIRANPDSKVVTKAYNLKTGEEFASAGIKKIREGELRALELFRGKEGFVQVEALIKHDDGGARILFEMCELGDLNKAINTLTFNELQSVFNQFVKAITYMHEKKTIHRDIKPGNIFLTKKLDSLRVKVGDFGFACLFTEFDQLINYAGTIPYIPPEVVNRKFRKETWDLSLAPRMDVWSTGVSFSRILSKEFRKRIKDVQSISSYKEEIKPENESSIEYVLWRMLQKNLSDRPDMSWVREKIEDGIDWSSFQEWTGVASK